MLTRLGAASSESDGSTISGNSNKELNMLQQIAMDEFLLAQTSGDKAHREEKWRELVRVMKGPTARRSRSRSSRGSSNRSYNTSDEILGFIRIGGGGSVGGDSIASGLTSPTASPMGSPYERKGSLPRVGSRSPYGRNRRRDGSLDRSVGDDNTLPTFPSLPGRMESSMGTLPTFPSLPGNRVSDSEEKEERYSLAQKRSSVTDSTGEDEGGAVFLDIVEAAAVNTPNVTSKESDTWDSLLLSSNDCDDVGLNTSTDSSQTNSIVKNLVGRYETSINKSISQNPSFFQRTNPTNIKDDNNPTPQKSEQARRVVSASPAAPTHKEVDTSASTHKSRKSRRENSLEEQVRNVLEKQQSHTVEDVDDSNMPRSPSLTSLPLKKPDNISRRVKSESVASAQDILEELRRSPTPTPVGPAKLPRSISVGAISKSPRLNSPDGSLGSTTSPPRRWNSKSPDRGGLRSASPLALAPSRRDLPRLSRLNRKSISEPNAVANACTVPGATPLQGGSASVHASPKSSTPVVGVAPTNEKYNSTTQRTHNSVFPCTSPLTVGSDGSSKNNAASVKSNETPLVTKSPVGLPPSKRDVPPVSSSRRVLPSVKEIAARFNGQMKSNTSESSSPSSPNRFKRMTNKNASPTTNRSVTSGGSKDRIDEIRASITKLKHDGVGGIGKATSTLVRNQETGRYIIRDVDDNQFDDIMLAEMMRPKMEINEQSPQEQQRVVQEHNRVVNPAESPIEEGAYIGDVNTVFRMPSEGSMASSVLSDGVVDDAVRAAIDAISSTSTDDVFHEPSSGAAANEDDFFVVKNSSQWSSFQTPSGNKQGSFIEDAFDIDPLNDWDDSGSDEWRDEKDTDAAISNQKSPKTNFPSPTSVILGPNRKFLRDEQRRNQVAVASWNPFDM